MFVWYHDRRSACANQSQRCQNPRPLHLQKWHVQWFYTSINQWEHDLPIVWRWCSTSQTTYSSNFLSEMGHFNRPATRYPLLQPEVLGLRLPFGTVPPGAWPWHLMSPRERVLARPEGHLLGPWPWSGWDFLMTSVFPSDQYDQWMPIKAYSFWNRVTNWAKTVMS